MTRRLTRNEATKIIYENMPDDQIKYIIKDYLDTETTFDIKERLSCIKGFKTATIEA